MATNAVTKQDLEKALEVQTTVLTESIRGLNANFTASQGAQNETLKAIQSELSQHGDRLEKIEVKIDAIMESVAVRQELRNLVLQLKEQGITLNESKI